MALGTAANAQEAQTQDQNQGMQQTQMQQAAQTPQMDARSLMDKKVLGSTGEELGQVADVVIDPDGQARMVVVKLDGEDREVSFRLDEVDLAVQVPMTQDQTAELRDWDEEEMIDADWGTLRANGDYYAGGAGPMADETAE
ncbi:hypothetical protein C882_0741 [Caenispirillum salinarum AK4]|uniref:PRC-barrel domain-containing protein n=2 Tax=Caenispirillum TaxID=414051 RepID=K9GUS9_9PROT|nr:hypothetical protein C882_0741 [Caenispirillum salinarum AK4]